MREYLRTLAKVGIALACVWHMAAIGVYSIPVDAKDPVARWFGERLRPAVIRYVLITSQWQQWNLFAPNPLRRMMFYRLDAADPSGAWTTVATIDDRAYGPWRHAVRFKLLGQALEEKTERPELAERAALVLCREHGVAPGTPVRVWHEIAVIPYVSRRTDPSWWAKWTPTFEPSLAIETTCKP